MVMSWLLLCRGLVVWLLCWLGGCCGLVVLLKTQCEQKNAHNNKTSHNNVRKDTIPPNNAHNNKTKQDGQKKVRTMVLWSPLLENRGNGALGVMVMRFFLQNNKTGCCVLDRGFPL